MSKLDSNTIKLLDEKANELFTALTSNDSLVKDKVRQDVIELFKFDPKQLETSPVNAMHDHFSKNVYLAQLLSVKTTTYLEVRKALGQNNEERTEDSLLLQTLVAVQFHTKAAMGEINQHLQPDTLLNRAVGMIGRLRGTETVNRFKPH